MNRTPTEQQENEISESLARLAEIAESVSRQQSTVNPGFGSTSGPIRKRPVDDSMDGGDANKRMKKNADDPQGDVRFREYQAEIWSEKFEDLCEFRRFYGHCHVPHYYQRNAPLAQWVKRQRYQYKLKIDGKRSTLSDERVRLLNKIGFIWNSHDAVWEERWNELLIYKRMNGDCIVPSNYEKNPQLAVWVKRQRRQYKFYCEGKSTSMTPERIAKLDKLGFAWDCRKKDGGGRKAPMPRLPVFANAIKAADAISNMVVAPAPKLTTAFTTVTPTSTPTVSTIVTGRSTGAPPAAAPAPPVVSSTNVPLKMPKCEFFTFSRKFST